MHSVGCMPLCVLLIIAAAVLPASSYTSQVDAIEGRSVRLDCASAGRLSSALGARGAHSAITGVQWRRNGTVVAQFARATHSTEWWSPPDYDFDRGLGLPQVNFSLTLRRPEVDHSALYDCKTLVGRDASREAKEVVALTEPVRLRVVEKPAAPGTPAVTAFTSRSATVSWAPHPGNRSTGAQLDAAPIIQYYVIVSVGESPNENNRRIVATGSDSRTAVISSLAPFMYYTFQVQAENLAGKSVASLPSAPLRTKGEPPVAAPRIEQVYNATNSSLVVTWNPPPENTLHGPLVGYRVTATKLRNHHREEFYIAQPNINSYVLDKLDVYTKYSISVAADNNFGYSPEDSIFALTAEGEPGTPPQLAGTSEVTSHSVQLRWLPPRRPNGVVTHYTIYYATGEALRRRTRREMRRDYNHNGSGQRMVMASIYTKRSTHPGEDVLVDYTLDGLESNTQYSLKLTASTAKGEGPRSEPINVFTDTDAPSAPVITHMTMPRTVDQLSVHWKPPQQMRGPISVYMLRVRTFDETQDSESASETLKYYNSTMSNSVPVPVKCGRKYLAAVRALTKSVVKPGVDYIGPYSKEVAFMIRIDKSDPLIPLVNLHTSACGGDSISMVRPNLVEGSVRPHRLRVYCQPSLILANRLDGSQRAASTASGVVAVGVAIALGIVCAGAGLMLALLILARRRRIDDMMQYEVVDSCESTELFRYDDCTHPSVPVSDFVDHCRRLAVDDWSGYRTEYASLECDCEKAENDCLITAVQSTLPCNKSKNRYSNIVAYDHSRVLLQPISDVSGSDYINANFVDGVSGPRAYIATQGPLPHTFADFWRMVWEQRCSAIVMITNVLERGRKKCDQYWPSEGSENYGHGQFQVKLLNETVTAFYVVRVLSLKHLKCLPRPRERLVFQYHYTHWPDHGVPDSPLPVLAFVRRAAASAENGAHDGNGHHVQSHGNNNNNNNSTGPVVVHCSAGVGRSGTYIVLDSMLRLVRRRAALNVLGFLKHIRRQRNFLDQYVFCHDALAEAIASGVTEIPNASLPFYVDTMLHDVDDATNKTLLQLQYEQVTSPDSVKSNCVVARQAANMAHNRPGTLLPLDDYLVPMADKEYINATVVPGYERVNEYIITPAPMPNTLEIFWRMVWQQSCQTIVLLCGVNEDFFLDSEKNDDFRHSYPKLWPEPDSLGRPGTQMLVGSLRITLTDCFTHDTGQCVDVLVSHVAGGDDFSLPVRVLYSPDWPPPGNDKAERAWDLVQTVADARLAYHEGPMVVVDALGGCAAASFCVLSTVRAQMDKDCAVDVYMPAKLCHMRRPGVWPSQADYHWLYECGRRAVAAADWGAEQPTLADALAAADDTAGGGTTSSSLASSADSTARAKLMAAVGRQQHRRMFASQYAVCTDAHASKRAMIRSAYADLSPSPLVAPL